MMCQVGRNAIFSGGKSGSVSTLQPIGRFSLVTCFILGAFRACVWNVEMNHLHLVGLPLWVSSMHFRV